MRGRRQQFDRRETVAYSCDVADLGGFAGWIGCTDRDCFNLPIA